MISEELMSLNFLAKSKHQSNSRVADLKELSEPTEEAEIQEMNKRFGLIKLKESSALTEEQRWQYTEVLVFLQDPQNVKRKLHCVKNGNYRAWASMIGTSGLFKALNYRGIGSSIEKITKLYRVKAKAFEPWAVGLDCIAIISGIGRGWHDIQRPNHPPNLLLKVTDGINYGLIAFSFTMGSVIHIYRGFFPGTENISDELFYGGFLISPALIGIIEGIWQATKPLPNEERRCCSCCCCGGCSCCCNCSNKTKNGIDAVLNTLLYSRIIEMLGSYFFSIKNNYSLQIVPFFVGGMFVVLERHSKTREISNTAMQFLSAIAFGAEVVLALLGNGMTFWGCARIISWGTAAGISLLVTASEQTEYVIVYDGDISLVTRMLSPSNQEELGQALLDMDVKQRFDILEGHEQEHKQLVDLQERQALANRMKEKRQKAIDKLLKKQEKAEQDKSRQASGSTNPNTSNQPQLESRACSYAQI